MKAVSTIAGAVLLMALGGAANAATTTIDFTDGSNGPDLLDNRYSEDGYDFTGKFSVDYHWLDIRGDGLEPALLMDSEFNQFDITASGKQFALSSFDYAGFNSPRTNSITFTGYFAGTKVYTITEIGITVDRAAGVSATGSTAITRRSTSSGRWSIGSRSSRTERVRRISTISSSPTWPARCPSRRPGR